MTTSELTGGTTPVPRAVAPYIGPGRAFLTAFLRLSPGEKSELRRGDPLLSESFWTCVKPARKAAFTAGVDERYLDRMEVTLAAMAPILSLKEQRFSDCGKDLGSLLRDSNVSARRVEATMTERELGRLVQSLESILRIGKTQIDFGVLLGDLVDFQINSIQARRRWARSLFMGFDAVATSRLVQPSTVEGRVDPQANQPAA